MPAPEPSEAGPQSAPTPPQATAAGGDSAQPARPPAVSLPTGGGALRGIGEKFAVNPATGTASLTIPLPVSAARDGMEPQLALTYDSGTGNGPFGLGWQVGAGAIARKTDKGVPRYVDTGPDADVFVLSGAEDLVPVLDAAAGWRRSPATRALPDGTTWWVERYRPRVEQLYARVERWTPSDGGPGHWRLLSREGVVTLYGASDESRISCPGDPLRVFSWLVTASYDAKGNAMLFRYRAEDSIGVDVAQAHERNRDDASRGVNRYLERVLYGNATPRVEGEDLTAPDDWLFELVLDYGDHAEDEPLPAPDTAWPARPDPFSSYRAGFEVRTHRLCRRVLMFHHFADEPGVGRDCLTRSLELTYSPDAVATMLTQVTLAGHRRGAAGPVRRSYPPVELTYSAASPRADVGVVTGVDNLPEGVREPYRLVDLDGEGLPGVLVESQGALLYKRNVSPLAGRAAFAAVETIPQQPNAGSAAGGHQLLDVQGDGRVEVAMLGGGTPGFYARADDGGWQPYRPFTSIPGARLQDPQLRLVDLTGDGLADVLVSDGDALRWNPSLGELGFGDEQVAAVPFDDERGPRLVFSDGAEAVYLADVSGDGLADLVRVRNGEVCYWPSLGYGRFGAKVVMDNAPLLDGFDGFDQRRVRLADVDGTGPVDLVYVAAGRVVLCANEAGNAWAEPRVVEVPELVDASGVVLADLLGTGTSCVVWSSAAPSDAGAPLRYVDLMADGKPRLLTGIANNLGAETLLRYAPSTAFYAADRAAGRPWLTKLPFCVQVVERVDTRDHVSNNVFSTRYAYHQGYFDGAEREFRGFAQVEQWDTELLEALTADGRLDADNVGVASHVPPVLTRTWFHTGAFLDPPDLAASLARDFYREGDRSDGLSGLTDAQLAAMTLPESRLPTALAGVDGSPHPYRLTVDEQREACRALKGSLLRQEVYGLDGTDAEDRPYRVTCRSYTVELLQPRADNTHAVLASHLAESVELQYERALYVVNDATVADPRVTHSLTLDTDAFGDVLLSAEVGYGRRHDDPAPELTATDRAIQHAPRVTYAAMRYTNAVDAPDAYRAPVLCETASYELVHAVPDPAVAGVTNLVRADALRASIAVAGDGGHDVPPQDVDAVAARTPDPYRRLLRLARMTFRSDDLTRRLPLGSVEPLALPDEAYRLVLPAGLVDAVYQRQRPDGTTEPLIPDQPATLGVEGGLVRGADLVASGAAPAGDPPDDWWLPSGRVRFSTGTGDDPATELAAARVGFFAPTRYENPFGATVVVERDRYALLPLETRDALDNRVTAGARRPDGSVQSGNDYRVLQPALVTDPNGNRRAAAFDALGFVVATAVMGKEGDAVGDSIADIDPDPDDATVSAHLADPTADPAALLGRATSRYVYDLGAYARTRGEPRPHPAVSYGIARETHDADLPAGTTPRVQHRFTYTDGLGRVVQAKAGAEPVAGTPRWVGSGWRVYNNKGAPVREYEPFFSDTHEFELARQVGVAPILLYDPLGRVVGTIHADHSWEKVAFDPWRSETWDVNDTAAIDDPTTDPTVGGAVGRLPAGDYLPTWQAARSAGALGADEQLAAAKALVHAGTPLTAHFDALGRAFLTVSRNRYRDAGGTLVDATSTARLRLDVEGNPRAATDALGRLVERAVYDLGRTRLLDASMDSGSRWTLNAADGKLLRAWDSRGHAQSNGYDVLRRPTDIRVSGWDGVETLTQRTTYGEAVPDPESSNLRGRLYEMADGAGRLRTPAYDFKGNIVRWRRELALAYRNDPDWSGDVALGDAFDAETSYDALDRPLVLTAPDGSVARKQYNEAGLLERLDVTPSGGAETSFVRGIDYDAKGRRLSVEWGNGATTAYRYDELSNRLVGVRTLRDAGYPDDCPDPSTTPCGVQNLSYTYDAVGNVVVARDDAQPTVFFRNRRVDARSELTYDALYRLVEATGREHLGQVGGAPVATSADDAPRTGLASPGDGNAMGRYRETYSYDPVGNIVELRHRGEDPAQPGWRRAYTYAEPSLLEPADASSNRLTSTSVDGGAAETYSYDEHGNLVTMAALPTARWDYRDRLRASARQVVGAGTPETTYYTYEASGARARKVTDRQAAAGSEPTRLKERVYVAGYEVYREFGADGATVVLERQTLHVGDDISRIALVETRAVGDDGSPRRLVRYQLTNLVGSACLELADDAAVIAYEEYYPYGGTAYQAVRSATETPRRYRWASRERDEESGLYCYGNRYYSSWLGRWTSCDPAGTVDGSNPYMYVRDNPIVFRDPSGRQAEPNQLYTPLSIDTSGRVTWNPYQSDPNLCGVQTFQLGPRGPTYRARVEVLSVGPRVSSSPTDRGGSAQSATPPSSPPERTFWSRGGATLATGALLVGVGLLGVLTGGGAFVLIGAAMALSAGIAGTSIGATQLAMSYSGQTNAQQDEEINRASGFMMSLSSSPTGLVAGTTAVAITGDVNDAQRWADIGGLTEGGVSLLNGGGRMAVREFQFGIPSTARWGNTLRTELRPVMGVSEDVALRSRFNPAFPRNREWIEFSHWFPQRSFEGTWAEWVFNRPWNLEPMWASEHALVDPFRLRFIKQPFRTALEAQVYTGFARQLRLAPSWVPPTVTGAGRLGAGYLLFPEPEPEPAR